MILVVGAGISIFAQTRGPQAAFTSDQTEAGRTLLRSNKFGACTDCHGPALLGRDQKGLPDDPPISSLPENFQKTIRMGYIPQLVGPAFVARWRDRSTKELSAGFPMRFDGALTREQQMSLMAFILQMNGALPGQVALTMDTDVPIGALLPTSK
ncbi:MAG TPA: hypothetical protein VH417_19465 [Vicinamibacterales bacterium]